MSRCHVILVFRSPGELADLEHVQAEPLDLCEHAPRNLDGPMTNNGSWSDESYYSTIQLADIDGDGQAS